MRSSPPFQLALVLLGFIALAWPLIRLTSADRQISAVQVKATETKAVSALLRVSYAHEPQSLSVKLGEKTLLTEITAGGAAESTVELPLTQDGIELAVEAQWPAGTPNTALSLELEPDGLDAQSQTRWTGSGSLSEILPFIWKLP
jgi:hypothetical protein